MIKDKIKVIAFDADDTLWDNQHLFEEAERNFCEILSPYGTKEKISEELFRTESNNMAILGYDVQAFTISMMETALKVSNQELEGKDLWKIMQIGKGLLYNPATPLPGVEKTLQTITNQSNYKLALMTKGNTLDQNNKLMRSGLRRYFDQIIIVDDKTTDEYQSLCYKFGIKENELLMIGNSLKSDIIPAIKVGAFAIHIPYELTWLHEHIENFKHERLTTLRKIEDIIPLLA